MNNQNSNQIDNTPVVTPTQTVNSVPLTPVQPQVVEPTPQVQPSLMRETIDEKGNAVYQGNNQGPDIADKTIKAVEEFMDTKDHKDEFDMQEVKKYRGFAVFSYIPITCLAFLIMGKQKESDYMKFHLNQGLVITIIVVTVSIISILWDLVFTKESMVKNSTPIWVSFLSFFLYSVCLIMMLYGIANTASNSSKEIPIIGQIKLLK